MPHPKITFLAYLGWGFWERPFPHCTVSLNFADCVREPEFPLTVIVYVAAGVVEDVSTVSVAVCEPVPLKVTEFGDKLQLRPSPPGTVQVRFTAPTKYPAAETVTVEVAGDPGATLAEPGFSAIVKPGFTSNTTPQPSGQLPLDPPTQVVP